MIPRPDIRKPREDDLIRKNTDLFADLRNVNWAGSDRKGTTINMPTDTYRPVSQLSQLDVLSLDLF